MKTHRQELIEKLDNEFGRTVNATQVMIEHLLLLCDMLDERAEQGDTAFMRANNRTILDMQSGEYCRQTPMTDRLQGNMTHAVINPAQWQCDADQFRGVTEKIETPTEHAETVHALEREFRDGKSWELERHAFPDELVERLAPIGLNSFWGGLRKWADGGYHENMRAAVRAVLAELAKADITELPKGVILPVGDATGAAHAVLNMVRPVLAAKDAEILRQQGVIRVQNRIAEDYVSRGVHEAHIADLKTRIAELENHAATITAQANQYRADRDHVEETCRMHSERVIALEKQLAATSDGPTDIDVIYAWHGYPMSDRDSSFEKAHSTHAARVAALFSARHCVQEQRIAGLEKRIAELTVPLVVDGKTPGQVNQAAFAYSVENHHESKGVPNWEIAAQAVLRVFGNGAEALRQVRKTIRESLPAARDAGSVWKIDEERVYAIIDAEIAKLA